MHLIRIPMVGWVVFALVSFSQIVKADGVKIHPVFLFPAPEGLEPSPLYKVQVEIDTNDWQSSYVYFNPARRDGSGADEQKARSMNWTTFCIDRPTRIRITSKDHQAENVVIRPSRFDIKSKPIDPHTIELTLEPGQKVSVEFPGTINPHTFTGPPYGIPTVTDALLIFADTPPSEPAPSGDEVAVIAPGLHATEYPVDGLDGITAHRSTLGTADQKPIVRFLKGIHDLGYWQVPNNIEKIHLDPGAVVFGALDILPLGELPGDVDIDTTYRDAWHKKELRPNFQLTGHGVLSGTKLPWHLKKDFSYHPHDHYWQHVKLVQLAVEDVILRDVTLVDAPYWTVSFINDADKRTTGTFENFKIVGSWTYNNDGLPLARNGVIRNAFIHANDDSIKLYHSDAKVENCVLWQNCNGAVFQFGWFPKSLSNVTVTNVDIIHFENWYGVNQSNRAVFNYANAGGPGLIENISFDHVTVEGRILRLFGFNAMGQQQIRYFRFNRLECGTMGIGQIGAPGRNYFLGDISGFSFSNFTMGEKLINDFESAQFDVGGGAGHSFQFDGKFATPPAFSTLIAPPSTNHHQQPSVPVIDPITHKTKPEKSQDITSFLQQHGPGTYMWSSVFRADQRPATAKATLIIRDESGQQFHPAPDVTAEAGKSAKSQRETPVSWTELLSAELRVQTVGSTPESGFTILSTSLQKISK